VNRPKLGRVGIDVEVLLITGVTRSGKALVAPIVSSFEGVGRINVDFFMEQIPALYKIATIDKEAAIYLLKTWLNLRLYDEHLGRSLNFRKEDFTSIYKYKEPNKYIKNLERPERGDAISEIENEGEALLIMTHYTMQHAHVWIETIERLKIIDVIRHPVEIATSWNHREYGAEFYGDKRSMTPSISYKGEILPYYALGWEDEYLGMSSTDRIIEMLFRAQKESLSEYKRLKSLYPEKIYRYMYESLLRDHKTAVERLTYITGKQITKSTYPVLLRERIPRDYIEVKKNQNINFKKMVKSASVHQQLKLIDMIELYEKELNKND
jgi:hypothetical protein